MKTRHRLLFGLGIGLATLLLGVITRQRTVIIVSLPLLWYAAGLLISMLALPHPALRARRTLDTQHASEHKEFHVRVDIRHHGPALAALAIRDELPSAVTLVEGEHHHLSSVPPGGACTLNYTVEAPRGTYEQSVLHWIVWSGIGLAAREGSLACATTFSALPVTDRLPTIDLHPRRVHAFTGPIRSRAGGSGVEFFGCRAFSPGDDIRRINWRASARQEAFILNEYELERMTDVNVILDVRASAHVAIGGANTFEPAVRAAASLAAHFLRQGNRVGYLSYGDYLKWVFPTTGRIQLERILRALAAARLSNRSAFEELRRIPTRLFASGSQLILLSTLQHTEDIEVPAQLAARGYSVLLIYLNPLPMERSSLPDTTSTDLALRILRMKRNSVMSFLAGAGVETIDWDITQPLAAILYAMSRRRRMGGLQ